MWELAGKRVKNRLLLGTACYPSLAIMEQAIRASEAEVITLSIKRQAPQGLNSEFFWSTIKNLGCHLLPNTAGCRDAKSAITTAMLSRELFDTPWIKLEVIGDDYHLQPEPFELVEAAKWLINEGFEVFPYCTDDLVICQKLVDAGCKILMPWAAPIGSGKGLINPFALETLRCRFPEITLIVDAGIGKPSHAVQVMELGFDGVLLNTAVAQAADPILMAKAFRHATMAGHQAFAAGMIQARNVAQPSTPLIDTPFWHYKGLSS
ncbi:thiazole synthase [Legionella maceachernii]|uniref:Thiazole synthase n=1 Tax=Legionella maceachernii TaxID=466 RepID=A0A0W0VUQ3_9GAMM|nr:thiazole synthase [Legionella maceachernii]KTD24036.1 thiamine (thiazole) biosynthesis protein ThiG [Legionella maceachernii]SJZ84571.1 thiazole-phosphate synthase [Legionella maceachernii]SUO99285.1 Thiazole synthase [Legionella maceachernii]